VSKKTIPKLLTAVAWLLPSLPSFACPDLSDFYRAIDDEFQLVESQLLPLLEECSENSEYFSLLGTVQLRSGDFFTALETLERALLLNPDNGSALVDYAEVLFQQGQVLSAVEINTQLLSREDLPVDLAQAIADRQRRWRGLMSETSSILGVSVGYDNNLNSAPMGRQLALTLSGQSVVLDVSPEFLAVGGSYANLGLVLLEVTQAVTYLLGCQARLEGDLERTQTMRCYKHLLSSPLRSLAIILDGTRR